MPRPSTPQASPTRFADRPTAVVGDVHGCGEALARLLERLDSEHPAAAVILVGDLLTKGPEPELVVEILRDRAESGRPLESVCGNHDRRMLAAILAVERGLPRAELPSAERRCLDRLERANRVDAARAILESIVTRVEIRTPMATVLHAGIDPARGLAATPDELKWSIRAREGERPWWEGYHGEDGLIVFGHRPQPRPIRRFARGRLVAVNVDTGCVVGGPLTAYLVGADRFVAVRTPAAGVAVNGTRRRDSSARRAASAAPARRTVGSA